MECSELGLHFTVASVEAARTQANLTAVDNDGRTGVPPFDVSTTRQTVMETNCLWCGRTFSPRATGGSAQRFCSTGHRQAFWIAARRWTMRAVEAGLLSVECLK